MGWSGLTLVSDSDLGGIEPQTTAANRPWGASAWPEARAAAKQELKILIESAYGKTIRFAADRVLDAHRPAYILSLISGTYADITAVAVDHYEDDIDLTQIFASASNKLYIGCEYQFDGLSLLMKDALNAQARVLTVKYSGASGFAAFPNANDGTAVSGKTFAQGGRITWPAVPPEWVKRVVGSLTLEPFFWVELSVDQALSSGATKATQLLTVRVPDGLRRVATLLALYYILNGLERQSTKPKDWAEKALKYRTEALELFALLKEQGGIPIDENRDEVIEPAETIITRPLRIGRA